MFKLTIEVDGYGTKQEIFLRSFDQAIDNLSKFSGIYKDGSEFKFVEMKDATISTNNETYFRMCGVPYDEIDEHDSRFGTIEISQEDFEPKENTFVEVVMRSGYYEEIICNQTPYSTTIGFFDTDEEAKEHFKDSKCEKSWNRNCGPLRGWEGEYLDIKHRTIGGK